MVSGSAKLSTCQVADEITRSDYFARDASGLLYVYRGGYYHPDAESYVRRQVKTLLHQWGKQEQWSSKLAAEACEYIRVDVLELWEVPPEDVVNVENGLLNVVTRELRPHSHEFLSSVQLPVRCDAGASGRVWEIIADTVFPEGAVESAFEIAAWAMLPEHSIQRSVVLTGEGSNGKSTYLQGLCAFLGRRNIASVSLHKLEADKFAAARLVGKLANICPDLPNAKLVGTSAFRALTGGNLLHAERKYRESFGFRPFAKLIFSSNQLPPSDDPTYAFFRRWLIVPFMCTFEEGGKSTLSRKDLDSWLADPEELSGLLNKALDALPRLRSKGFTVTESMRLAVDEFRQVTDPLTVWLNHCVADDPTGFICKGELMAAYNAAAVAARRAPMMPTAFGLALRRARPSVRSAQKRVDGKVREVYLGLRFKPGGVYGV